MTLITGFRTKDLMFWAEAHQRIGLLQAQYLDLLGVTYTTNDSSFGIEGFVTGPLEGIPDRAEVGTGRGVGEVVAIGPPLMMRAVVAAEHRPILCQAETLLRLPNLHLMGHEVSRLNRYSADLVPPVRETERPLPVAQLHGHVQRLLSCAILFPKGCLGASHLTRPTQ